MAAGSGTDRLMLRRLVFLAAALSAAGCMAPNPDIEQQAGATPPNALSVEQLPGWQDDDTAAALAAFVRGCEVIAVMPVEQSLGGDGLSFQPAGQVGLWQTACTGARGVPAGDDSAAKAFFSQNFNVYEIGNSAVITGYFEPEYPGSRNATRGYPIPLYAKPADPILANLPRADIDHGALTRKAPVTAYLSDPVDAFMLQIEGSGRIVLPDGRILRVGRDGQNGQPYVPIGRILVANGDLAANDVSPQSISAWLKANPSRARQLMEQNPRYVFLRPLGNLPDNLGAPGSLGVPLTAGRSLAVDKAAIPLGSPVFISTTDPLTNQPLDRLVIAQDTGGELHGAQTADLFFGAGPDAEATASRMQQQARLYILLPKPSPVS